MTQQTQQHNTTKNITITDRFEFRDIHAEEADRAVAIEQICFPPHEACSEKSMKTRIANAPELFFMEQNLFRPMYRKWPKPVNDISITSLKDPRQELSFVAREIVRLVRTKACRYRDFAVVTGDVPQYANYVPETFAQYGIPFFIDQTRNILFHPFIEFIRAALEVVEFDFSYQSVFRFLRSGLAGRLLTENKTEQTADEDGAKAKAGAGVNDKDGVKAKAGADEDGVGAWADDEDVIDRLENYVLAKGIRGRKRWSEKWTSVTKRDACHPEAAQEEMALLNRVRERIVLAFEPLCGLFSGKKHTVAEQTYGLYEFISALDIEAQLKEKQFLLEQAEETEYNGVRRNQTRAQEYGQIYKIVMDLFDKVTSLLGEEQMSIREYGDILDAGFSAAKVGMIPPGNDRVTVGDIERTRLNHIRILFFVGVNDGIVPKAGSTGSIISQFEREKMAEHHLMLAPGAREKVFIQKFYLYLNLTKPSDGLYVTYSRVSPEGKALRRSYLIGTLCNMFPELKIREPEEETEASAILTPESGIDYLLEGLWTEQKSHTWEALAKWYLSDETYHAKALRLLAASFYRYSGEPIGKEVARALYGTELENSVTRLEQFAECAFAHYMTYGLGLSQRELQEFAGVDMGNIYHQALENYSRYLKESSYSWFDITEEAQKQLMERAMEEAIASSGNAAMADTAANRYQVAKMKKIFARTIWALTSQIRQGKFEPSQFEVGFSYTDDLNAVNFKLSEEEHMRLQGRIDRIDTYEDKDKLYVKIIDYKSGNTGFELLSLYHGLKLQLVVYMNAAMELFAKQNPAKEVVPAGMFYYHIDDPMVEGTGSESEEEIRRKILENLRLDGVVNTEDDIYRAMDVELSGKSNVLPISVNKDGTVRKSDKAVDKEEFRLIADYANYRIAEAGNAILKGNTEVNPYLLKNRSSCDYCPYAAVCGFDKKIPGYEVRRLEELSSEEIYERMKEVF